MKKYSMFFLMLFLISDAYAQFQFNPQAGITMQTLANASDQVDTKARVGYLIGADGRFGEQFYFQPGIFYGKSSTEFTTQDVLDTMNTSEITSKLDRTIFTIKVLGGFNLVQKEGFKLRVNAGPAVDFITKVEDEKDLYNEDSYNKTLFNFKVAAGVDVWFLTAELGYGWGITNAFDDTYANEKSKFNQFHFTVGIILGKGTKD